MATAQDAAIGFVRKLRPTDLGEVIGFDSRAEVLQKFTSNTAELEQAIRKTVAGGSTSMNNALYISLKGLKKIPMRQEEEIRRQAIILLSDGEDTSSLVTFEDVLDLARRSETAIYAIGLMEEHGRRPVEGLPRSDLRAAPADDRHRRPGVLPGRHQEPRGGLRPDLRRAVEPVHDRLHLQESPARRRLAPPRGSREPAERDRPAPSRDTSRRLGSTPLAEGGSDPFSPTNTSCSMNADSAVPLCRCRRGVCRAVHAAARSATSRVGHRAARARRLRPHVRHRHGDDARGARAVRERHRRRSRRSSGCWRCRTSTSS